MTVGPALSLEWSDARLGAAHPFVRGGVRVAGRHRLPATLRLRWSATYGVVVAPDGEPVPDFERFHVGGWAGAEAVPASERFFVGGWGAVRGFGAGALGGPGDEQLLGTLEVGVPLAAGGLLQATLFTDVGQAWCRRQGCAAATPELEVDGTLWRAPLAALPSLGVSVGLGVRARLGPTGSIRFECARPLTRLDGSAAWTCGFRLAADAPGSD